MKVTAIQMDPAEAEVKLDHYREVLQRNHTQAIEEEFEACIQAYRELAKGTPLIDPVAAIRECSWRADGRPVLAIARADQTLCSWSIPRDSRQWNPNNATYVGKRSPMDWRFQARKERWDRQRSANLIFEVPGIETEPPVEPKNGTAMVPLVPADVYPSRGLDLSKHFVLWEVEDWDAAPPVDPMLLKPIGGSLYAVIAQWNLTEVERAIISATRREQ